MRVFVAGATGAIGRPLLRQLVAAGHEVTGTTRSESRAEDIRALGATPAVCDALDSGAVHAAVEAASPEVLVNQLTDLPKEWSTRYGYGATGALRSEGTRNLIEAGRTVGASRIVSQSVAFIYAPTGDMVKNEDAPTIPGGSGKLGETVNGTLDMERRVTQADGIEGLVLRYGFFYGPGTWYAPGTKLDAAVRRRRVPIVGDGTGLFSFIHVEDAASATVAALDHGSTGIYNVVDDEPATMADWIAEFARITGAKKPRRVPLWLAKLVGGQATASVANMRGASNAKAKRELAWEPAHASWRDGFRELLGGPHATG